MIIVGVDIAAANFVAQHPAAKRTRTFDNTPTGFKVFQTWLLEHSGETPTQVVMEATGIYWSQLATFLYHQGFAVSVVNPSRIKYFAKTKLMRTKTDPVDARLIQEFGETLHPDLWNPAPMVIQQLKTFQREHDALKHLKRLEENRLHALENHVDSTETFKRCTKNGWPCWKTTSK